MDIKLIDFQVHGDERGGLVALEKNKNIPFRVQRVYYLFNTVKGVVRGLHAHKTLRQLTVAIKGSCHFKLDDGKESRELTLDDPSKGLYLGPGIWREMSLFSRDCVLLVLADQLYDESDYIREYDLFIRSKQ